MFKLLEWITVISGLVYLAVSILGYNKKQGIEYITWTISSLAFFLIAIALATSGLAALELPVTPYLGSIYPSFLAIGILVKKENEWWKYYLYFTVIILIIMAIGQSFVPTLGTGAQIFLHTISGLIIVFLPLMEVLKGNWSVNYLAFTVGGIVIGIGGLALATIVAGAPMLPFELVVQLLHPLLFISAFLIAIGVYLTITEG